MRGARPRTHYTLPTFALYLLCTITILSVLPDAATAQCTSTLGSQHTGGTIAVFGLGIPTSTITNAVQLWSNCAGYGTAMPNFVVGDPNQSYPNSVNVIFHNSTGANCGTGTTVSNGVSEINLWADIAFPAGSTSSCAPYSDTLAHELGHTLGLGNSICEGFMMSSRPYDYSTNTFLPRSPAQSAECNTAASQWTTPPEEACP